jgi:hypothetical protein
MLKRGVAIKNMIKNKVIVKIPNLKKLFTWNKTELSFGIIMFKKAITPSTPTMTAISTSNTLFNVLLNLFVNFLLLLKVYSQIPVAKAYVYMFCVICVLCFIHKDENIEN